MELQADIEFNSNMHHNSLQGGLHNISTILACPKLWITNSWRSTNPCSVMTFIILRCN